MQRDTPQHNTPHIRTPATVIWLKYCQDDVKHKTTKQKRSKIDTTTHYNRTSQRNAFKHDTKHTITIQHSTSEYNTAQQNITEYNIAQHSTTN